MLTLRCSLVLWLALSLAGKVEADETVYRIDLPALTVAEALHELSAQTGVPVLFPYELARHKQANPVAGRYTLHQALDLLLRGTGLSGGLSEKGVLTISVARSGAVSSGEMTMKSSERERDQGGGTTADGHTRKERKGLMSLLSGLGAFIASVVVTPSALAQESQDVQQTSYLEEVVVTARKREESLLEVPLSISAFTSEQLQALGAENFEDFAVHVPGLSFFQRDAAGSRGGGPTLSIRGVNGALANGDAAIGYYLNETPVGSLNVKLVDIDRVEVLKGPQGTLYGGRAMGGLVKIVTRQANAEEFDLELAGDAGSTSDGGMNYDLSAAMNIPLVQDRLGLRIVGYGLEKEGYVDWLPGAYLEPLPRPGIDPSNIVENVNDETTYGGRLSLAYTPADHFTITLESLYEQVEMDARSEWDLPLEPFYGELVNGSLTLEPSEAELHNHALTIDWDLSPGVNLVSNSSVTRYETFNFEEGGYFAQATLATVGALFRIPISFVQPGHILVGRQRELFTQEVRLASAGEGRLEWLAGAFYQDSKVGNTFFWEPPGVAAAVNGALGIPLFPNDLLIDQVSREDVEEYGLFGELSYELTQQLSATLGLRYFDNELAFFDDRSGFFRVPLVNVSASEDGVNPKFVLAYAPSEDLRLYASFSQGFRRAGANRGVIPASCAPELAALGFPDGEPASFDSDELNAYEIGAKGTLAGGRATFESAVFFNDWRDKQQVVFLPQCGFNFGANIGRAEIFGAELTTNIAATDQLSFAFNVGYLDAQVAEDTPEARAFKGDPLPITPDWQAGATVSYTRPITAAIEAFARLDYQYRDELLEPTRGRLLDSYDSINLRLGVSTDHYDLSVYAENLTDERGQLLDTSFQLVGQVNAFRLYTTRPRTIGLRLIWRL